jgi:hypothetical protein
VNLTDAVTPVTVTAPTTGAGGNVVTEADGGEAAEVPAAFVAVAVNV